jgi:hypothetical protein
MFGMRARKAAKLCSRDEHEDQACVNPCMLPGSEIFFLRTGQCLWNLKTTTSKLVADFDEPHRVISDVYSEPICWTTALSSARAASATTPESAGHISLLDLMQCRKDRQAIQMALHLLRHCPDGLVSMSAHSAPDRGSSSAQIFLVLSNSRNDVYVEAHKICKGGVSRLRGLEPILHVDWWTETDNTLSRCKTELQRKLSFDDQYERDSGDEIYQDIHQDEEFETRDPLEVAATQRCLVQDLLRRTIAPGCRHSTAPISTPVNLNRSQEMLPSRAQANISDRPRSSGSLNSSAVNKRPEDLSLRAVAKRITSKVSVRIDCISRKHAAACGKITGIFRQAN